MTIPGFSFISKLAMNKVSTGLICVHMASVISIYCITVRGYKNEPGNLIFSDTVNM